jgi:hypothetical protein
VAHLTEGTLRRMVDDPDARTGSDAAHLDGCIDCQARLKAISDDAHSVATLLAVPESRVDVARAFGRVMSAPKAQPALLRLPMMRPAPRQLTLAFVAAIAVAAVALVAFVANGFLYKPTSVATVPITVADVQALSQLSDYGTITWTKQPNLAAAVSASDAATAAGGLQPPVVSQLPAGVSTTVTYGGMSQAVATFTFSADKAAAAAAAKGKTLPPMPANINGATLTFTVGPAVGEIYGDLKQPTATAGSGSNAINLPQLIVAKSDAPTATATQVSVTELEDFILAQPGITPELKAAVKAIGDPSTTLLIPVPVQYASSTPVKVAGVDGIAVGDNTGVGSGVVWVGKDGYVYVVVGSIKQTDAITIANNLK